LIKHLSENQIFVFGSNLAGRHGRGAAKQAVDSFGAVYGQAVGLQGKTYAIPTKDKKLQTLPLGTIGKYVLDFLKFAGEHSELEFLLTKIGCGLAGYPEELIKPLFYRAPENIVLPDGWERNDMLKGKVLLVAGSRSITDKDKIYKALSDKITEDTVILSGGADGVDSIAEQYTTDNGIDVVVLKAPWSVLNTPFKRVRTTKSGYTYNASAGYFRNVWMGVNCDEAVVFWDGKSPGTRHMLDLLKIFEIEACLCQ